MRKIFIFMLVPLFLNAVENAPPSSPIEMVDQMATDYMQKQGIPGMAIAAYYQGQGFIRCYGVIDQVTQRPVTPNTLFLLASITKVFTSTELALQVEQGRMQLEDSVTNYLPGIGRPRAPIHQVTLLQLATHTSSLPRDLPPGRDGQRTMPLVLAFLQNWSPSYPIGSRYVYSNFGYGLLGLALENAAQTPYETLLRQDILNPLGMGSTSLIAPMQPLHQHAQGYLPNGQAAPQVAPFLLPGGGALRSTAHDMLQFLEASLGEKGPPSLLNAMQLAERGFFPVKETLTLGLGWQRALVKGQLIIDKNGGLPGFGSYIGMLPAQKIGVVVLANKSKIDSTRLGRLLLLQLSGH